MFKRFSVLFACMLGAAIVLSGCSEESSSSGSSSSSSSNSSSSASKIDQSSITGIIRTHARLFFIDQDFKTIWKLLSPSLQEEFVSEELFVAGMKEAMRDEADSGKEIKEKLKDKAAFDEFVESMFDESGPDDYVEIDGKWYINKLD